MKSKFELLAVSSIWISIVAACCPLLCCLVYDVPYLPIYSVLAFLCAFFVYSIDKISGSKEDLMNTPERAILSKYPIRRIAYCAYAAAILLAVATDWRLLPNVIWFGLAGWLYAKPGAIRLKDIPGLKSPYVAATWAYSFAGMVGAGYSLIFLLILINTILFDLRDLVGDRAAGVRTLPVIFGPSRTILVLAGLNCVLAIIHPITAAYGFLLLWHFRVPRPNLQYDLFVDGWPIVSIGFIYLVIISSLPSI